MFTIKFEEIITFTKLVVCIAKNILVYDLSLNLWALNSIFLMVLLCFALSAF